MSANEVLVTAEIELAARLATEDKTEPRLPVAVLIILSISICFIQSVMDEVSKSR